jgi:hypothetical protein
MYTCAFEIDGRIYFTDQRTLERLNYHRKNGAVRIAQWIFALGLVTGQIEPTTLEKMYAMYRAATGLF